VKCSRPPPSSSLHAEPGDARELPAEREPGRVAAHVEDDAGAGRGRDAGAGAQHHASRQVASSLVALEVPDPQSWSVYAPGGSCHHVDSGKRMYR
jgi:hypothetical protein